MRATSPTGGKPSRRRRAGRASQARRVPASGWPDTSSDEAWRCVHHERVNTAMEATELPTAPTPFPIIDRAATRAPVASRPGRPGRRGPKRWAAWGTWRVGRHPSVSTGRKGPRRWRQRHHLPHPTATREVTGARPWRYSSAALRSRPLRACHAQDRPRGGSYSACDRSICRPRSRTRSRPPRATCARAAAASTSI